MHSQQYSVRSALHRAHGAHQAGLGHRGAGTDHPATGNGLLAQDGVPQAAHAGSHRPAGGSSQINFLPQLVVEHDLFSKAITGNV